jgi:CubicO group peptidase (beta-lactamase class C family)
MSSTSFSREKAERTGQSSQAFDEVYRRVPHTFTEIDMPLVAGMGGVLSTAPDILRWARLFLGGLEKTTAEKIIPRTVLDECTAAQALLPKQWQVRFGHGRVTYGFGWFQDEVAGVRVGCSVSLSFQVLSTSYSVYITAEALQV